MNLKAIKLTSCSIVFPEAHQFWMKNGLRVAVVLSMKKKNATRNCPSTTSVTQPPVIVDCKKVVFFANLSDAGSIRTKGLERASKAYALRLRLTRFARDNYAYGASRLPNREKNDSFAFMAERPYFKSTNQVNLILNLRGIRLKQKTIFQEIVLVQRKFH